MLSRCTSNHLPVDNRLRVLRALRGSLKSAKIFNHEVHKEHEEDNSYDAYNRRIARTYDKNGPNTSGGLSSQYYVYDRTDAIIDFYDSDGPSNIGGTSSASAPVLWNRYLWNVSQATDGLLAQESYPLASGEGQGEGELWWTLPDRLGSIREYQRADNNVTYIYYYDSYGNKSMSLIVQAGITYTAGEVVGYSMVIGAGAHLIVSSLIVNTFTPGAGSTLSFLPVGSPVINRDFRYLFTCQEYDSTAALYYYDARWYDSVTGRFFEQDPIGFTAGDSNLYRYCNNSPTVYTDSAGLTLEIGEIEHIRVNTVEGVITPPGRGWYRVSTDGTLAKFECTRTSGSKCTASINLRLLAKIMTYKLGAERNGKNVYDFHDPIYNTNFPTPRNREQEAQAVFMHEMDHVKTYFVGLFGIAKKQIDTADGTSFSSGEACKSFLACVEDKWAELWSAAEIHSKTFDWVPWNGGDMYDVHPFSHEFDLTPCYMFAWDILY